ncbi:exodeoxyribonuclease V subunit gamma [Synechococcus sp. A15-28]|uniref:exodeoxyribonuclease V subunit gamma n=1 Tax=Synechococcus sp. A15-28 TaxID=1050638 RepID=UPI0016442F5B|nr:exodeoxyribonuclease V subunit gamma [Synechococcus sp. A15-28]QNI41983.1 exodeoxyribonuclease V (RecBCD complex)/ gamma subunit [Synechococcus sp. A15-28]
MLTLYRSNRAEFLATLLARQLLEERPDPFETVEVLVNTWPTSRWLGEQLATANGISSLVRFPFPGSRLRQLVRRVLDLPDHEEDPWRATSLVWTVLELMPALLEQPVAQPLRAWLKQRDGEASGLSRDRWQLARAIADAFDDYALYRPATLHSWMRGSRASTETDWQPWLARQLDASLHRQPFGLQVQTAVERLCSGAVDPDVLPKVIRLFGISALAPVQVDLIQALSGTTEVQVYLLTPCRDLWQRCGSRREQLGETWIDPPDGGWLQQAPRLEATLGRMGAEFQQLLEGSGDSQLGERREGDLFADPVRIAEGEGRPATLLERLQQQQVEPGCCESLEREHDDRSLLFQAAPGPLREVQLVRDQVLQWLAADPELEPRDVLVMTPQIDRYAPLLSSVFNDRDAIGVDLPWRLTDRSQQSTPGLTMAMLELLDLAAGRLTATGLERLLANPALQAQQGFSGEDAAALTRILQRTGFRWGLDALERGGDETHSLIWSLDRWLLGLALPQRDGLAPGGTAPFHQDLDPQRLVRWWTVLDRLVRWLQQLRRPRASSAWVELLQALLEDLFADGGDWSWERQSWSAALADWQQRAAACPLELEVAVAAEVLAEALSVDSGRFGHRSGALTVSALEPMRAIPHKVIVLMGLDDGVFPRIDQRPGFHLLEQRRWLGDPCGGDQDRYVLLEALMSARRHLLISWCGRNEHTGEPRPAAAPVEQWLQDLSRQLGTEASAGLCIEPDPNPLDRSNFHVAVHGQPLSCDRRQLEARRWLDRHQSDGALGGLALPLSWSPLEPDDTVYPLSYEELLQWLVDPQSAWLRQLGLHPGERVDPVEDLEALALTSLLQAQLLNQDLEGHLLAAETPAWRDMLAGQGVLPPGAGAELEQGVLNHRLQALQQQLNGLGGCRREGPLLFAGDIQVVVQPGRFSPRGLMRGWLQHLQLCADAADFGGSAVIARADRGDEAKTHVRWIRLEPSDAEAQLQSLQRLAQQGQHQCWPVPPKSGWLLMSRDHSKAGSGGAAFRDSWIRERQDPQQRLCFGADIEADLLLKSQGFEQACALLYAPMLQALVR